MAFVVLVAAVATEAQRNNFRNNNRNNNRNNANRFAPPPPPPPPPRRNNNNNNNSNGRFRATPANARDANGQEVYPGCNGTVCLPMAQQCAVRKQKCKS